MVKILVLNVGNSNKGSRALVESSLKNIKEYIPDATFILMGPETSSSEIKKQIGLTYGMGFKTPKNTLISVTCLIKCIFINLLKKMNVKISISKKSRLFYYFDADLIINSGGDHLSGEYGFGTLSTFMDISYSLLLGKPVVLYGESLGNFNNKILNIFARFIFNKTKLIIVREKVSKEYLEKNNVKNPKICLTADPAFLLDPSPHSHVVTLLNEENIKISKPIIGINPSGLISKFSGKDQKNAEKELEVMFARVIDNLIESLNVDIILIPHVYSKHDDDRLIINSIYNQIKNKPNVNIIKKEYSPQELKGIIGICDLFIGSRMHATIAATSMLIPTVGIAYSHKMVGIIGEMLGMDRYVIDIKKLDYYLLTESVNDLWNNKEHVKEILTYKIPKIQEKSEKSGKILKEVIDSLGLI